RESTPPISSYAARAPPAALPRAPDSVCAKRRAGRPQGSARAAASPVQAAATPPPFSLFHSRAGRSSSLEFPDVGRSAGLGLAPIPIPRTSAASDWRSPSDAPPAAPPAASNPTMRSPLAAAASGRAGFEPVPAPKRPAARRPRRAGLPIGASPLRLLQALERLLHLGARCRS